jgi:uroporphyrinogen decarboxylase
MTMTLKERIKTILSFHDADIVPWHILFTEAAHQKTAALLGDPDFESKIGNHLALCGPQCLIFEREFKPGLWRDNFGVTWNRTIDKDIGTPEGHILWDPTLRGYEFPDPIDPALYADVQSSLDEKGDRFVVFGLGFSLFERAWTMRGMENLLADMIDHPPFVDELLEAICEWNLVVLDQALQYPVDGCYFGDDWGCQRGLIMGAPLWRRFIKPRLADMYHVVKASGRRVFIHSCGDVKEILPDLIEIGVDVFNPFQPEVMDVVTTKRKYQGKLSFFGGISIQHTLPYGTPDEVRATVRQLLRALGTGGGYIASPAHAIPKDVPAENIVAMLDELQNQKR